MLIKILFADWRECGLTHQVNRTERECMINCVHLSLYLRTTSRILSNTSSHAFMRRLSRVFAAKCRLFIIAVILVVLLVDFFLWTTGGRPRPHLSSLFVVLFVDSILKIFFELQKPQFDYYYCWNHEMFSLNLYYIRSTTPQ